MYQVNCKNDFFIYLLECKKCHIQYVGKGATDLNLKLNNHHKDVYKADAILAPRYFGMKDHIFNRDTSFIINEQTRKNPSRRETKKKLLKQREKFWVMKLETLNLNDSIKNKSNKEAKRMFFHFTLPSAFFSTFLPIKDCNIERFSWIINPS